MEPTVIFCHSVLDGTEKSGHTKIPKIGPSTNQKKNKQLKRQPSSLIPQQIIHVACKRVVINEFFGASAPSVFRPFLGNTRATSKLERSVFFSSFFLASLRSVERAKRAC